MYYPSLEEVKRLSGRGNLVPIYREILADLETPVSAYLKVSRGRPSFLLESVEGGERLARYSFIGAEPYLTLRLGADSQGGASPNPLAAVKAEMERHQVVAVPGLPRFHGGAVGYLSYEVARHFERLPTPTKDPIGVPEAVFLFTDTLLVFDHVQHRIKVVSHVSLNGDIERAYDAAVDKIEALVDLLERPLEGGHRLVAPISPGTLTPTTSNTTPEEYAAKVVRCREYIAAGDIVQVVPAQRFSRATPAHPFQVYRALRAINPSPYMYYLNLGDFQIVGASPELLVRVEDGEVTYRPLAGTRPRGQTPEEDKALEEDLKTDEKERAEHIQLVDLGRNDVGRVCEPGTVQVTDLMYVTRYSHVMHLESEIRGRMRADMSALDALEACFPAGTLSGCPKIRAMEIIAELEGERRGPYGGAVGYVSFSGNLDTAITIRTAVFNKGVAHWTAGGGIVWDSVPEEEYQESVNKARAVMRAIDMAEQGL